MRRPRISIAGLMVFVVFLGITFAALRPIRNPGHV